MSALLRGIELGFVVLMAGWTLGSLLYALPFPTLRRRLAGFNSALWFANWTVFGAGREQATIAAYTLEYRDRDVHGDGSWIVLMEGRPWVWHAFLWQPERRIADRLHRMAEGIARLYEVDSPAGQRFLADHRRRIAKHVAAMRPLSSGSSREIRIIQRRSQVSVSVPQGSATLEERVLISFSADEALHVR